jgi:hypothetical protein
VSGVILQLQTDRFTHYAEPDSGGRFLFDGLPAGIYQLSVFAAGFPQTNQLLAGPRWLNIKEKSCVRQAFVFPKPGG